MAQSVLTGKISGATGKEVELNISRDVWYQAGNSVYCELKPDGSFSFTVPGTDPLIVTFLYNKQPQRLLLSPGRPLHITFENADLSGTIKFSGKAAAENMLVYATFPPRPFFLKEFSAQNTFGKMSRDSLMQVLLPAILKEADSLSLTVTGLPSSLTSALRTNIKYYYALNMEEFSIVMDSYTGNPAAFAWKDTVMKITGVPSMEELNVSPYANYFLYAYSKYKMAEIFQIYRKDKAAGTKIIEGITGLSFDSLRTLADGYGDEAVGLLMAEKVLPPAQYERLLANRIIYYSNDKELAMARKVMSLMKKDGKEKNDSRQRLTRLENMLAAGKENSHITIHTGITTLEQLLAPYKGKLVYLDIWGTWCGPCKQEMRYAPQLKEQMKGKDVVFLYLSNDSDLADQKWKEYIQVNNITGEHARITGDAIEAIWQTLLPGDPARRYPTFFIIDREGKVLVRNAKRPSDEGTLYTQLLGAL
ncbi:TlpA disulfide reductase family protein [Chitinophaga sp. SYP-B3965]|uniref:TlpA family protein disulfide reductase n=1 Tax=Chitinophaga sp. SYP-B3965 TaxID=2663120 RepID=UPI001564929D|nr:TlpA disulfide reductase family protein [Chitinophaga sp. SYP-B3965]